ncbi:MAG TPA: hypothetical protein VMV48_11095 [Gallionellaceae bacterium]|nr:hypothetical protein [Gallionellaceae bacterium]
MKLKTAVGYTIEAGRIRKGFFFIFMFVNWMICYRAYSIFIAAQRVGCAVRTMVRTAHPTLPHLAQMPDLP